MVSINKDFDGIFQGNADIGLQRIQSDIGPVKKSPFDNQSDLSSSLSAENSWLLTNNCNRIEEEKISTGEKDCTIATKIDLFSKILKVEFSDSPYFAKVSS